jgi:hypothetical protein
MGTRKIRTAGSERQSALDAATQLMAEREKYEQWLDDLEAKKDSTPAKVFDRVRQDYIARLQTVMEQLEQYTTTLHEHADSLMEKLRDLEEAEEANTEEQAEAALRKQVGEITATEWETGSRKAQRELAKIKENQVVILSDLNRIRDLFGDEEEVAEEEEEETAPAPRPAKGSKEFNELEFLSSVVGPAEAAAAAAARPEAKPAPPTTRVSAPTTKAATPSTAAPAQAPATRVSAPTTKGATPPTSAPAATPVAAAPPPAPPAPPLAAAAAPAAAPTPPAAAPAPPAAPAPSVPVTTESSSILRSSGASEQPKTLKCTECASMNYPSEWYCERCGAELTVV